jgi:hypothetical protein
MNSDLVVIARLTPSISAVTAAAEMTILDSPIRGGLPHIVELGPRLRALLVLPTGLARPWLDLPASTPVSLGGDALAVTDPTAPPPGFGRAAPRLRVQRDKATIAVLPLVAGLVQDAADAPLAVPLQLQVLDWALHVGTVRGAGDFGSFLRLAFRVADRGVDIFGPLPLSTFVIQRLPVHDRIESRSGRFIEPRLRRLVALKERLR